MNLAVLKDHPYRTLTICFAVCLAVFLVSIPLPRVDGMLIGSDGVGYYVYLRSLVLDGDLDFTNEYTRLQPGFDLSAPLTATGLRPNQFAIGPALLWMPFFLLAHGVLWFLGSLGAPVALDGYGYPYQAAVCVGSTLYGYGGMLLIYASTRRLWPPTALAACLCVWFGTHFVYYQVVEPSMSHMCSFFAVSLMLSAWLFFRPLSQLRHWLVIGLCGGLVAVVRQPDVTLLALPLLDGWMTHSPLRRKVAGSGGMLAGFLLAFSVQMAAWAILNGNPLRSGYLSGGQGFSWFRPHLWEVLFSLHHGLFLWHPLLLLAVVGWAALWGQDRRLTILLAFGFLSQAYVIAAWSSWQQGDSFGGRMFIASLPLFIPGLAGLLDWARSHKLKRPSAAIGIALILWNGLFLMQYRLGFIPMNGPYHWRDFTIGKWEMLTALWQRVVLGLK